MKLRIKGNSVRVRLSKTEVDQLASGSTLTDSTSFGSASFGYSVKPVIAGESLTATYKNDMITLFVPHTLLKEWPTNSVVGFESMMQPENSGQLHLLLEKDFKCLDNTTEDQSGFFDNPSKTC
jgi:hypothetical protein